MNITKVSYSRKFSLPNYENLDLSIEAQLNEKDNPLDVWSILADNTEIWFIEKTRKAKQDVKPQTTPQQPAPQATPTANMPLPSPSLTPLKWEPMPATETNKGAWEKTVDINNPEIRAIADKLDKADKPIFEGNYLYWIIEQDEIWLAIGRRKRLQ